MLGNTCQNKSQMICGRISGYNNNNGFSDYSANLVNIIEKLVNEKIKIQQRTPIRRSFVPSLFKTKSNNKVLLMSCQIPRVSRTDRRQVFVEDCNTLHQ